MPLEFKDILTIGVSCLSLIVAISAFLLTYFQRWSEDKRNTRKALTDTLTQISQCNLAMAQLSNQDANEYVVGMRRQLNSQRRYLSNHANFLMEEIPNLVADIDHGVLASAFDNAGDSAAARIHWENAVLKSPNETIRAYNLRGYAYFLFTNGYTQAGRQNYENALRVNLPDDDKTRYMHADTLLLWSIRERDAGFLEEARRRREQSITEAGRIASKDRREAMLEYIFSVWKEPEPVLPLVTKPTTETKSA
jgi:tetratricopeptide (TPR) repeat protein